VDDENEETVAAPKNYTTINLNAYNSMLGALNNPAYTGAAGGLTYPTSANGGYSTGLGGAGGYSTYVTSNYSTISNKFKCETDAEFNGDIKWKGRSLGDMLETIEKRLSILTPDPKKLAKYEALQKAYEYYKTLEAMCYDSEDDENGSR